MEVALFVASQLALVAFVYWGRPIRLTLTRS